MLLKNLFVLATAALTSVNALVTSGKPGQMIKPYKREPLQDLVTWDEDSLFVRGERILFYSGEFHPFRLPVPDLWLDVFQKIKALGYNGVSFYVDWALLEGKQGRFTAEGVFALEPFFEAASTAGIYLLARPGPYINAEVSGGGYPGWIQRNPAILRTRDQRYLDATSLYVSSVSKIIAKAQITNGGPVILFQPENEYTNGNVPNFPDPVYYADVEKQYRDAGIVVPFINNDASPKGYFAPEKPAGVDIYGHDGYPLGFDCANPTTWPDGSLPTNWRDLHLQQSPNTPYSIIEFQGGSFDPWGGLGFEQCSQLLNAEFERVFYKNDFSFGVTIFSIYMTYGGTNYGGIGHPGGYTSYDYGAVIKEDRTVTREKYSEAKLEANFLQASPAYLTAVPQSNSNANGSFTNNAAITTTELKGNTTKFFIVRHAAYNSLDTTNYKITFPTSQGNITVPQLGGTLSLHGRDSKIHVSDYDVGSVNLLYSSAEIFTWKKYGKQKVLVVYGGPGEQHELAVSKGGKATLSEGKDVKIQQKGEITILNFAVSGNRRIVDLANGLRVVILDRYSAYNYWVVDLPSDKTTGNFTNPKTTISAPIVRTNYLLRSVQVKSDAVHLVGDLNSTSPIEVFGAPNTCGTITFNGLPLNTKSSNGILTATATYKKPTLNVPDLSSLTWKSVDNLPELSSTYSDAHWTSASLTYTNNTIRNLTTPTSLYASDYGYNTGSLLYRGHFIATGSEKTISLSTSGGSAYGHTIWLNDIFVGSFDGADLYEQFNQTYSLPSNLVLTKGKPYVFTILIDHMGLDENFRTDVLSEMKTPRGIYDYDLSSHPDKSSITWKVTGNFGGEDYQDISRGPLNEGATFAERNGYHLPGAVLPSSSKDVKGGPNTGISNAGVHFYATSFKLDFPQGYDIPLALSFTNSTSDVGPQQGANNATTGLARSYRVVLFVNGWQFGKYVHNVGPQDVFPVPQGVWDYHGENYLAVSLWALESGGAKTDDFKLVVTGPAVQTGYGSVALSPGSKWEKRAGAY